MTSPLDEDAPALAQIAVQAVRVLNDATDVSVAYPGLGGTRDTEAVLSALARLAEQVQETAAHLGGYLSEQLQEQRLHPAHGTSQLPESAVDSACAALAEVREAAVHMAALLTAAELAMLAIDPTGHR